MRISYLCLFAMLLLMLPVHAGAQAMLESSGITSQVSTTAERPDWAKDNDSAAALRFVHGAGLADGSWFRAMNMQPGAFSAIGRPSDGTTTTRLAPPPPRPVRPKSTAPGRVAGLVYESGNKRPVAGVTVLMLSTEAEWATERLEARTDSAGYYEFNRVNPGAWLIGIPSDRLSTRYVAPRNGRPITVAKRDSVAAAAFELRRTACLMGHAGWSDGYVLYDATLTVAPYDSSQFSTSTRMNGLGDFRMCGAPEDSVMVWMHLRDGRSLGHATRLSNAADRSLAFTPDPLEKMEGCLLRIQPVLNDGSKVERARVTIVGRRFEQGARPALVFVREQTADDDGIAEFKVPFGVYEVLAMNPREGQTGRVSRMVVDKNQIGAQPLRVEMRGTSTAYERARMRSDLLNRAETYLYVWQQ